MVHLHRKKKLVPDYLCQRQGIAHAESICQHIPGSSIEKAITQLLLELVKPVTLELTFAIQQEVQARIQEADKLR